MQIDRIDRYIDRQKVIYLVIVRKLDNWIQRYVDSQIDGYLDRWIFRQMDIQIDKYIDR